MANKISVTSGSIHSSVTPVTLSTAYPVDNILNGDRGTSSTPGERPGVAGGWQYNQGGEILNFPLWAIVDLGQERPVSEFKIFGLSNIWGGGSCPQRYTISVALNRLDGQSPEDGDFTIVAGSSMSQPLRPFGSNGWSNSSTVAVTPQFARFVKVQIDSIYDDSATEMGLGEFEIYGNDTLVEFTTLTSDAEIGDPEVLHQVTSDAYIEVDPIIIADTDQVSVTSNAEIDPNLTIIDSDAVIYDPGMFKASDAFIANTETQTILSSATVMQTSASFRGIYTALPGSGSINILPEYDYGDFIRPFFAYSILDSTSLETIVPDMFTSTVIDLQDSAPPFGYQNYDWSYDWVARTYNNATYYVETRTGTTEAEATSAVFSVVPLGYRYERGSVPRYHQYRLHVWASGAGDFEFHQFTVRGHVNYNTNIYYRSLIEQPFLTTNVVNFDVARTWEPDLDNSTIWEEDYIPGDVNGDGVITAADVHYLIDWLLLTGPAPTDLRTADVDGDGIATFADVTYLLNYISGSGPPPRIRL